MRWNTKESDCLTLRDEESADEVISQYDLSPARQDAARAEIARRAKAGRYYPGHVYHIAHCVCAEISRR